VILVDTSVWVDHLRTGDRQMVSLLQAGGVYTHAWVIGELACGNLAHRQEVLGLLRVLPQLTVATDEEALYFIERHQLMGRGIGYIDVHLLAAAAIHATQIWTRDKRLNKIAEELGLAYIPDARHL